MEDLFDELVTSEEAEKPHSLPGEIEAEDSEEDDGFDDDDEDDIDDVDDEEDEGGFE